MRAMRFFLLPVAAFRGLVLLIIAIRSKEQMMFRILCIDTERCITVVQTMNARRDWPIDESPDEPMGLPELAFVMD